MSRRHELRPRRDILSRRRIHGMAEGIRTRALRTSLSEVGQDVLEHVDGRGHRLLIPNGKPLGHGVLDQPSVHTGDSELRLLVDRRVRFGGRKPRGGFVLETLGILGEPALRSIDPGPPQLERGLPTSAA